MGQWIRSVVFTVFLFVSVPLYGLAVFLAGLCVRGLAYRGAVAWARVMLGLLHRWCGLGYSVEGLERLPSRNAVALIKHSSAWETLAQLCIFPRQTWVLKRELMWAPVLGWVLALLKPIAIDRKGGGSAVQQVLEQGKRRLAEGYWVMIFPEGTRVAAGESRRYGLSGALLAANAGCPVVPVAHNAGDYWPRRGLLKRRGTIRVVIGPAISTQGKDPRAINDEARDWIETTLAALRAEA